MVDSAATPVEASVKWHSSVHHLQLSIKNITMTFSFFHTHEGSYESIDRHNYVQKRERLHLTFDRCRQCTAIYVKLHFEADHGYSWDQVMALKLNNVGCNGHRCISSVCPVNKLKWHCVAMLQWLGFLVMFLHFTL